MRLLALEVFRFGTAMIAPRSWGRESAPEVRREILADERLPSGTPKDQQFS